MTDPFLARRVYRLLLLILPPEFRRTRTAEMETLFVDMRAERGPAGVLQGAAFWLRLLTDTVSHAAREWLVIARRTVFRNSPAMMNGAGRPGRTTNVNVLLEDLRHAARSVLRQPRHSALIMLLITISVAGNAAVFPLFNGFLLRPLPFEEPERLVDVDETAPQWNLEFLHIAWPDFVAWRRDNRTFDSIAVYQSGGINFSGDGDPQRITAVSASHDLGAVLRIEPVLGRFFTAHEDRPDAPRVVVLTEPFWRREFDGDAGVLGRTVRLGAQPFEIIGVLPASATLLAPADIWRPLARPDDDTSGWGLKGVGRLLPGVSLEQARADLLAVHRAQTEERDVNEITSPVVNRFSDRYLGDFQALSWLLLAAVGIVLVIACANVAGLTLARSVLRAPEITMRLALGARRVRLVRQLFFESLLVALAGGAVGVTLGLWGFRMFALRRADLFPTWVTFDPDGRFVAFTFLITASAAVGFGLWPAIRTVRGGSALDVVAGRASGSRRARRAMSALVVAEISMAVVLLIAAGIALRDMRQLQQVDPGYRADGVLSYKLQLRGERYQEGDDYRAFINDQVQRLRELPGVTDAAMTSHLPLTGEWGWFFVVEGAPPRGDDEPNPVVQHKVVTPGYIEAMGIELLAGRTFDDNDGVGDREAVVIINESFARHFFPNGEDPIGHRIGDGSDEQWKRVVGVTRDVRHRGMTIDTRPGVYQPMSQYWTSTAYLVVRTSGDPYAQLGPVRDIVRTMDATLPMYEVTTASERLAENLWTRRAASWLMIVFSAVALLLAATGLYGMISYSVRQRVREFGIRMALGADRGGLIRQVLRQGMALVVVGASVGLVTALAASGLLIRVLAGARPIDVGVYAIVVLIVAATAALANLVPAARAAATEPIEALRRE